MPMRQHVAIVLAALVVIPVAARSGLLPSESSYTIYIHGQPAGQSTLRVTETEDDLVLESASRVHYDQFKLDLKTRTVADKHTFLVKKFNWDGERTGMLIAGEAVVNGQTVDGYMVENGEKAAFKRVSKNPQIIFMEEYVVAHQVLMALAFARSEERTVRYGLLFPSNLNMTDVTLIRGGELSVESETKETICDKYTIEITGSSPFVSYYDTKRKMPVYLAFPTSGTEEFLDEFFGDKPISRWR